MATTTAATTRDGAMDHAAWMAAAAEEYRRLLAQLRSLDPADWARPTDCGEWDVRQVVAHLCGAAQGNARLQESVRQAWVGVRKHRRSMLVDSINDVQVADRASRTPEQLVAELDEASRRGVRTRSRIPAAVRAIVVPMGAPLGTASIGYLMDRIYTRDAWMHRIDIARATGRPLQVDADHDGRLVADLVEEWARLHGDDFRLTLTGPAGLRRSRGVDSGERIELDAVEFARTLAGRAAGVGLMATPVPF